MDRTDLQEQLPVAATVTDVQFEPDGQTYFCARLDQPIAFAPAAGSGPGDDTQDHRRPGAEVHEIVFRSNDPGKHPHPGM